MRRRRRRIRPPRRPQTPRRLPPPPIPFPPPPPPPTPPPADPLPPLAATAIDINDNHAVGADHWPSGATSDGAQGQPVNGIECLANMPEDYHVHTHLSRSEER